jgi:hypothetical protein
MSLASARAIVRCTWTLGNANLPGHPAPPSPANVPPPASVYSRLMAAIGRPDMTAEHDKYSSNSKRVEAEQEIMGEIAAWCGGGGVPQGPPSR